MIQPNAEHTEAAKLAVRDQLLTARRALSVGDLTERAYAVAEIVLKTPEVRRAATVAAYVSLGHEPGTGLLLDMLGDAGKRVIVPLLLPDNDLDWALYEGADSLAGARRGLLQPGGPPLGVEAISGADVVLLPGLAVDRSGMRLGRGGGSYDRALGRVPRGTFTCVLLHEGELLDHVPAAPHDRRVSAMATARGVTRF